MRDQRAHCRIGGRGGHFAPQNFRRRHPPCKQAHGSAFNIAFDAGDLPGKADMGMRLQAHLVVEQAGRIDERIAVNAPKTREGRIFQSGNHFEYSGLRAVFHLGLEPHDVVQRPQFVIPAQLHHGIGLHRVVRIGQAHGFHRPETRGFAAPFGHHFQRQTAIEIACGFTFMKFGLVGGQYGVDERLILRAVHRAVHVGGLFLQRFALVVA